MNCNENNVVEFKSNIDNLICLKDETIIWKYYDFDKFQYLIRWNKLFFSKLSDMSDINEGQISIAEMLVSKLVLGGPEAKSSIRREYYANRTKTYNSFKKYRNIVFINCWTYNDCESEMLWRAYTKKDPSIAIKTTYGNLLRAINNKKNVNFVRVVYEPFKNFNLEKEKVVTRKKLDYISEKELRLYIESENIPVEIEVDIDILLDKLYFSPFMASCEKDKIAIIITEINNKLKDRFMHSELKLNNKTR